MKDIFFLKRTHNDTRWVSFVLLFFFIIIFVYKLVHKEFNVGLIYLILFFVCVTIYAVINYKVSGLYINGTDITDKTVFSKTKVDINDVICIKLCPESGPGGFLEGYGTLKDENGNILFLMHFYSYRYEKDEINDYGLIKKIKLKFIEKHLACCIYDKEALDYLLTLNPNIKVIYEKE